MLTSWETGLLEFQSSKKELGVGDSNLVFLLPSGYICWIEAIMPMIMIRNMRLSYSTTTPKVILLRPHIRGWEKFSRVVQSIYTAEPHLDESEFMVWVRHGKDSSNMMEWQLQELVILIIWLWKDPGWWEENTLEPGMSGVKGGT